MNPPAFQRHTVTTALGLALATLLASPVVCLHAGQPLQIANFEQAPATNGWEVHVYGAQPRIALDDETYHEGRHALRISAEQPSDTALGREVTLVPNRWYALGAWVKSRQLDAREAPTFATLQVQHPGGRGLIASGASYHGDTDWTQVTVHFRSPADGRVRLCLFFVGFGKGTGTAWFDDVRLDETDPSHAPVKITRRPLVSAEINPGQYGQFVEYNLMKRTVLHLAVGLNLFWPSP